MFTRAAYRQYARPIENERELIRLNLDAIKAYRSFDLLIQSQQSSSGSNADSGEKKASWFI